MKHNFKFLLSALGLLFVMHVSAQSTTSSNVAGSATQFLGWDGTGSFSKDVDVTNNFGNQNINFSTNNGTTTTQKMVIIGSNGADDGNVGIGTTSPTERLTVSGGNIRLATGNAIYMIGNHIGLWNGGNGTNIFAGDNAGTNSMGSYNTFVGGQAGFTNTSGNANTFVGYNAGVYTTTAYYNTFVGYKSGETNTTGAQNCFYGKRSGYNNTGGSYNAFAGTHAGYTNDTANYNSFFGDRAGYNNDGSNNSGLGANAGTGNTLGSNNVFLGCNAKPATGTLVNATAVGAYASVSQSNSLVLGNINGVNNWSGTSTKVGIGTTAPATRLEVNNISAGSGLRFTQLTSGSTPSSANGLALSVNSSGDVILVPSNTGNVTACGTAAATYLPLWTSGTTICNSIVYEDGADQIGIGTTNPNAKFEVVNATNVTGGIITSIDNNNYGIGLMASSQNAVLSNIGIIGAGAPPITFPSVIAPNGFSGQPRNVGVVGWARGSNLNIGGVFEANEQVCPGLNIGVYASAEGNCFTASPGLAGLFVGDVLRFGNDNFTSDINLKDSISPINNALSLIARLYPKTYVFKRDSFPQMHMPFGRQFGVIAQHVDSVLPELVEQFTIPSVKDSTGAIIADSLTVKTVNYIGLVPIALKAIQELDSARMQGVTTTITAADSNRVVTWSSTDKRVTKGQIYDDGDRIGLPTVANRTFTQISTATKGVALGITSTFDTATQVINATYSTNGNANSVAAVRGFSKYTNAASAPDGTGGEFEGGAYGVQGTATGATFAPVGVLGTAANGTYLNIGVGALAESTSTVRNTGVFASAANSSYSNYGVLSNALSSSATATNTCFFGTAGQSDYQNTGAHLYMPDTAGINYALYASVQGNAPKYYAGYFNGDVHATGTVTWVSDARFKNNAENIEGRYALATLQKLEPKSYTFNRDAYPYLTLPQGNQYGLLAQDLEQVLPNLVSDIIHPETTDKDGRQISPQLSYKAVNYAGLIPLLVGAVKQQQTKIDSLETVISNKLQELENRINGCCTTGGGANKRGEEEEQATTNPTDVNRVQVELSGMQVVVLQQNVPNPFAEQTSISYFIPEDTKNAQIIFTDMLGATIKAVDVEPGYGIMTVFAQNLGTGQYSYSLLINGRVAETRKMMKAK